MAWLMRRKDRGSTWYVCFWTPDGREIRRAAGKSRRSAESIRAKIETQLREGKFFEREQRSTWTLGQLSELYLKRMSRIRPGSNRWRNEMFRQVLRVLGPNLLLVVRGVCPSNPQTPRARSPAALGPRAPVLTGR